MTFGEKLQKLRRESGLSQEKLAEQLNVSRQAVSRWELGTASPDVDNIVRLSKFFQVPIEYLMLEDCEDPAQAGGVPPTPPSGQQRAPERSHRWKWWTLGLVIAGVLLEALSYGLCYPMQEHCMRVYGAYYSDPVEYMSQMPLWWLTAAGVLCFMAAAGILCWRWGKRKWDKL